MGFHSVYDSIKFHILGKSQIKKKRKSPSSDQQLEKPSLIKKDTKEDIIINHNIGDNSGTYFLFYI